MEETLKRSRVYAQANLTKKINNLTELLDSEDGAQIRKALNTMREYLQKYQNSHDLYHKQLSDEKAIEASRSHYRVTLENVQSAERQAISLLSKLEKAPSVSGSSKASSLRSSRSTSSSYYKVHAAAKIKSLEAKAKGIKALHDIELEELKLKQRKARLELSTDIEVAEAERKAFEEAELEEFTSELELSTQAYASKPSDVTQSYVSKPSDVTQSYVSKPSAVTQSYASKPSDVTQSYVSKPSAVTQSYASKPSVVTQLYSSTQSAAQPNVSQAAVTRLNISHTAVTPVNQAAVTRPNIVHTAVTQPKVNQAAVTRPNIRPAVTQPKVNQAAVTRPNIVHTAVTQPKVNQAAVTQPKVNQAAVTQPKVNQAAVTQPNATHAAVTQSKVNQAAVTQPNAIHTASMQPKVCQTAVTRSSVNQAAVTRPNVSQTAVAQSNVNQPTVTRSSLVTPAAFAQPTAVRHQTPAGTSRSLVVTPHSTIPIYSSSPTSTTPYQQVVRSLYPGVTQPHGRQNLSPHPPRWYNQQSLPPPAAMNQPPTSTAAYPVQCDVPVSTRPQVPYHNEATSTPNPTAALRDPAARFRDYHLYSPDHSPVSSMSLQEELVTRLMESQERQSCTLQQIVQKQQESVTSLTLPAPNLSTFSGDPAEYTNFIKTFELLIESKTPSPSSRLLYLVQYTAGPVQELMRSCLTMSEEEGYAKARQLLRERYGQDYRIATALVKKLADGPSIKAEDSAALQQFSTNLTSCTNTLREIGCLGKLDSQDNLQKIIQRLPYGLRLRWRDVVDGIVERESRDATIDDVTKYVATKARAASHPVFGKVDPSSKTTNPPTVLKKPAPRQTRSTVFSTQSSQQQQKSKPTVPKVQDNSYNLKCPLCHASHWLSRCEQFRKSSVEDRIKFVLDKKLCNNCLSPGHFANACSKEKFCKVEGCSTKHSSFLHSNPTKPNNGGRSATANVILSDPQPESDVTQVGSKKPAQNAFVSMSTHTIATPVTCLAALPVRVCVPGKHHVVTTYAFLDNGSNTSFISEDLLKQLGSKGDDVSLSLTTLQSKNAAIKSKLASVEISDINDENVVLLPALYSVKSLPLTENDIVSDEDLSSWSHLKGIKLNALENKNVGLLIGSDNPEILQPLETRIGVKGSPYATRTLLGWTVNGPLERNNVTCPHKSALTLKGDSKLTEQFEEFCNLEFNDRRLDDIAMSREDIIAHKIMEDSAVLVDSHYEVAMPWKEYPPSLENNRVMAERRLSYLKRKLQRNDSLLVKYNTFISDMISKNQARQVPASEINNESVFYLPHHNVVNPKKPDKCRVVWDCAAKWRGSSLNDQLLQGPDLTNNLVGVLTRFREEPVAMMADVEGMFHQVRVKQTDRDYLRFLWWPDGNLDSEAEEYQMLVHLFGATSSPSCANFALRKTAKDNEGDFDPLTVNTVYYNFCVDDCLKSVATVEEAKHLSHQLCTMLSKGGFRLTKWVSNHKEVLRSIPEVERASSVKNLDLDNPLTERTLGVSWNVQEDTFSFKINVNDKPTTRRGLLSVVSSVYDPLGFVSPVILPAKNILQELCRKKLTWDDPIPDDDLRNWQEWIQDLHKLEEFAINRCLKPKDFGVTQRCELHHFADASEKGYGAVSYLRLVNEQGRIHCALIMSKSRLAPLKTITIPRLELSAAVLATRLDRIIRAELSFQVDSSTFWTDSTCVLRYIANKNKRFHVFVANRVAKILDQSDEKQWRYVDTESNPADEASRGLTVDALIHDQRWIDAPPFLYQSHDFWPEQPSISQIYPSDQDPEVRREATTVATTSQKGHPLLAIVDKFSSWNRMKRVVAWVLRYKQQLLSTAKGRRGSKPVVYSATTPNKPWKQKSLNKQKLK